MKTDNDMGSENLSEGAKDSNDSVNSSNSNTLKVYLNDPVGTPNKECLDEIDFYVNRISELQNIIASTTDPCDKAKILDELDYQENALVNFIASDIKPNSTSEDALIVKLIDTGNHNILWDWKGTDYLNTHYPEYTDCLIPVEALLEDSSSENNIPDVEDISKGNNSASENNILDVEDISEENNSISENNILDVEDSPTSVNPSSSNDSSENSPTSGDTPSDNNPSGGQDPDPPIGNISSSSENSSSDDHYSI